MTADTEDKILEIEPELAAHYARRAEAMEDRASDQLVKVSGWLTASLLAVNGGGAVATLQAAEKIDAPAWPLGAFGGGLILAMLSAVAIQSVQALSSYPQEELIRGWNTASVRGKFSTKEMLDLKEKVERVTRWSWTAPTFGWLSGVTFIVGGFWLVNALPGPVPAKVPPAPTSAEAPKLPVQAAPPAITKSQQVLEHRSPAPLATPAK
jgi:hypothetical protein